VIAAAPAMGTAVIYLRVSTDDQAASGLGLEAQLAACRAAADRLGLEAPAGARYADEGVSGAAPLERRPGLLAAVGDLRKGEVLLVARRDRLGRDPIAVAAIEAAVARRGARVVSAAGEGTDGDDPSQVLMRRLIDAFAEYERLIIKARTRSALAAKARRGERTGQVPYGKRLAADGVALVDDPAERLLVAEARALRRGGMGARAIARRFDGLGHPTKNGGRWSHSTIRRLLQRGDDDHGDGEGNGEVRGPGIDAPGAAPGDHPGQGDQRG
jgi:site-specific DNA recombinase